MIITFKPDATYQAVERLMARIAGAGLRAIALGDDKRAFSVVGDERALATLALDSDPAIETTRQVATPYKLASRELHPADTIVRIGAVDVGVERLAVIAGPCAVETPDQLRASAAAAKAAGASILRAGAYKPRTSPYSFSGHGPDALELLSEVATELDMPFVTEVMDSADVDLVARHADALQIGARNMHNAPLLRAVGATNRPILLKRGMSATLEELLLAAEHILAAGNGQVILCERGIRTFETATRNTFDLNAIPYLKAATHLPVIADPSHGTGMARLVKPMALAATAAGADGLMIEVHENPAAALSDGAQSLDPNEFAELMAALSPVAAAVGRTL